MSNNDNCLCRAEALQSATRVTEQRDLETYALLKILSHCLNCRGDRDPGGKST